MIDINILVKDPIIHPIHTPLRWKWKINIDAAARTRVTIYYPLILEIVAMNYFPIPIKQNVIIVWVESMITYNATKIIVCSNIIWISTFSVKNQAIYFLKRQTKVQIIPSQIILMLMAHFINFFAFYG